MAASCVVTINGQQVSLTYNSTSGKWEGTATAPSISLFNQSGGYYGVSVTATDDYGNSTTKDSTDATLGDSLKLYVKESTAPAISITSPSSGAHITNNTPVLTFNVTDNDSGVKTSSVVVKVDGTAVSTTGITWSNISGGKSGSLTLAALTDGAHTVTIDIDDNDGNHATQASRTFTVDTVAPTLNVTAPVNNLKTNNSAVTVVGTTNDATSSPVTVTIKLNGTDQGAVTIGAGGAFSKGITLADGTNTIAVRASDSAGKYTEQTITVYYNSTAPVISAVDISPNPVGVGSTYTISVTVI